MCATTEVETKALEPGKSKAYQLGQSGELPGGSVFGAGVHIF